MGISLLIYAFFNLCPLFSGTRLGRKLRPWCTVKGLVHYDWGRPRNICTNAYSIADISRHKLEALLIELTCRKYLFIIYYLLTHLSIYLFFCTYLML